MTKLKDLPASANLPESAIEKAQEVLDRFDEALKRANVQNPTERDRKELDGMLRDFPILWDVAGDIMATAADKLIGGMGSTYSIEASLKAGWHELPKRLARPNDGPLESLLVKQLVLCWLQLGYIEYQYNSLLTQGNTAINSANFWEQRLSAAQRRYLRAIEALARVRRLNLPAVQVNIGAKQVNQVMAK